MCVYVIDVSSSNIQNQRSEDICVCCYKRTREKGQGSEEDMARLKRVREESVRDLGIFLMIFAILTIPTSRFLFG